MLFAVDPARHRGRRPIFAGTSYARCADDGRLSRPSPSGSPVRAGAAASGLPLCVRGFPVALLLALLLMVSLNAAVLQSVTAHHRINSHFAGRYGRAQSSDQAAMRDSTIQTAYSMA